MSVTMNDFINLLKPGQLPELRQIVTTALQKVTTARMLAVDPVQIRGIGTSITNVITAGSLPILAVAGSKQSAVIQRVINQYRTLPTFLTAYATPTDPALIAASKIVGPPPGASAPSGAPRTRLALQDQPFKNLIDYINSTLQNFDSGLIFGLVKQNSAKKDAPTLDGLTKLVQEYIKYLNSIVRIFTLDEGNLDKNYYRIIAAIETILTKLAIIVPSARTPPVASIDTVWKNLKEVPLPMPAKPCPSGRVFYRSTSGFDNKDQFSTHFPNGNSVILEKVLSVLSSDNRTWIAGPWAARAPPVGAIITGIPWAEPNTKITAILDTNYPIADAGRYNPVGTTGYLVKIEPPLRPDYKYVPYVSGEQPTNRWGFGVTYTPIAAEIAEEANYPYVLAKWQQQNRTTPGSIYAEIIQGGNILYHYAVWGDGLLIKRDLERFNNPKFIAAIKKFPATCRALGNYIISNSDFLKKIDCWHRYGPHNNATSLSYYTHETVDMMSPKFVLQIEPKYGVFPNGGYFNNFMNLNSSNFTPSMIAGNFPIYNLLNWIPGGYHYHYIEPLYWALKNNPMTDQDKTILTSILTKVIGMHTNIVNYRASVFNYNIMDDPIIRPHIAVFNETFAGLGIAFATKLVPLKGGSKRPVPTSLKRRSRSVKRSRGTRKH